MRRHAGWVIIAAMRIPGMPYFTSKEGPRRLCRPFLEPGERVQHLLSAYQSILEPHWVVAVTDGQSRFSSKASCGRSRPLGQGTAGS